MGRILRSQAWFGGDSKDAFIHRSWMKNGGLPNDAFDGRPVISICNTFSELTPCNAHFRELVVPIKRGIVEASCDLPSIVVSGGPMLNGKYRGRDIGSGTDVWRFSEDVRAGVMSRADFMAAENAMSRSPGPTERPT